MADPPDFFFLIGWESYRVLFSPLRRPQRLPLFEDHAAADISCFSCAMPRLRTPPRLLHLFWVGEDAALRERRSCPDSGAIRMGSRKHFRLRFQHMPIVFNSRCDALTLCVIVPRAGRMRSLSLPALILAASCPFASSHSTISVSRIQVVSAPQDHTPSASFTRSDAG